MVINMVVAIVVESFEENFKFRSEHPYLEDSIVKTAVIFFITVFRPITSRLNVRWPFLFHDATELVDCVVPFACFCAGNVDINRCRVKTPSLALRNLCCSLTGFYQWFKFKNDTTSGAVLPHIHGARPSSEHVCVANSLTCVRRARLLLRLRRRCSCHD
jgi:hypothetical protein